MGYRTDFENLLRAVFESINVKRIDHDARAKDGNKPDFAVLKNSVPILYIEAKDIGVSLDKVEKSEQMWPNGAAALPVQRARKPKKSLAEASSAKRTICQRDCWRKTKKQINQGRYV